MEKKILYFQWTITALLLVYPVTALLFHHIGNLTLYFLLTLSFAALLCRLRPDGIGLGDTFKSYWPLHLAMASACLAVLFNQMWSGNFTLKFYDRSLRLAIFPLIFWVLFFVPLRYMRLLQWSFFVAVIVTTLKTYIFTKGGVLREGNIGFLSTIAYSDITLLAGVLCMTSIFFENKKNNWVLLMKILACIIGAYTSVLTATRGSWLAVPFIALFFFFFTRLKLRQKFLFSLLLILAIPLMLSLNKQGGNRFYGTVSDLSAYSQGEGKTTSTGVRLQLWGAAIKLFAKEPVFGIGRENYESSIKEMANRGEVTQDLTRLAHSHNEILFNMVTSGLLGLLSILALYLVPGYYFIREMKHPSPKVQTVAAMGVILAIGFFAFGLTDLMFFWPVLDGYYTIMVGALLVAVIKEKQLIQTAETASLKVVA